MVDLSVVVPFLKIWAPGVGIAIGAYAAVVGLVGMFSPRAAERLGMRITGWVQGLSTLLCGAACLLPAAMLFAEDLTGVLVGAGATVLLLAVVWMGLGFAPGSILGLALFAHRPAKGKWVRIDGRSVWRNPEQLEVSRAMKAGLFWAAATFAVDMYWVTAKLNVSLHSAEVVGLILLWLGFLMFAFIGGAIKNPTFEDF